jgi:phosphate transport system substrate-binding protein
LTLDQLKALYEGKVKNWRELNGPDRPIVVVSRDTSSGTYEVWEDRVLAGGRVTPRAQLLASNGAVAQAVAKNKNAIGYIGIGYLNKDLKAVNVNGITPSKMTTASGEYPISRTLFMFTDGWPQGETLQFINFVLHPDQGQTLVEETGYVAKY